MLARRYATAWAGAVVGSMLAGMVVLTPLRDLVIDWAHAPHSDAGRSVIYKEPVRGALESPVLGRGSPRPRLGEDRPSVGTHGLAWLVLFSQGLPGLIAFLGWALYLLWFTRGLAAAAGLWCHTVLLMGFAQSFFYGLEVIGQPSTLTASALALRDQTT